MRGSAMLRGMSAHTPRPKARASRSEYLATARPAPLDFGPIPIPGIVHYAEQNAGRLMRPIRDTCAPTHAIRMSFHTGERTLAKERARRCPGTTQRFTAVRGHP